jgi:hypothetical protein
MNPSLEARDGAPSETSSAVTAGAIRKTGRVAFVG